MQFWYISLVPHTNYSLSIGFWQESRGRQILLDTRVSRTYNPVVE